MWFSDSSVTFSWPLLLYIMRNYFIINEKCRWSLLLFSNCRYVADIFLLTMTMAIDPSAPILNHLEIPPPPPSNIPTKFGKNLTMHFWLILHIHTQTKSIPCLVAQGWLLCCCENRKGFSWMNPSFTPTATFSFFHHKTIPSMFFLPADLWPDVCDPLLHGIHWGQPVQLQNPDGDGREAGHVEPDPWPLGLHPTTPHRPPQNLPHR